MDKGSLSYWAGFFDGEGHIELAYRTSTKNTYYGHGRYIFQLWIDQRIENPWLFFGELISNFGGNIIPHKEHPGSFRWYISGQKGRQFLEAISPYLRIQKRIAELGIAFHQSIQKVMDERLITLPQSEIELRDRILKEYFSLVRASKSKRRHKFGRDYIENIVR